MQYKPKLKQPATAFKMYVFGRRDGGRGFIISSIIATSSLTNLALLSRKKSRFSKYLLNGAAIKKIFRTAF